MPVNAFTAPPDRIYKHLSTTPPESKTDPDVIDWVIETFVETGSSLRSGFCATTKYYCFRNRAHHRFRELFGVAQPPPVRTAIHSVARANPAYCAIGICTRTSSPMASFLSLIFCTPSAGTPSLPW